MGIVLVLSGLGVAKFRDVSVTKKFGKDVDSLVVTASTAQSLANSQNSSQCVSGSRLKSTKLRKINGSLYEVYLTCEGNYLLGTPTPSPAITLNPRIKGSLSTGVAFSTATAIDIATFLPGAMVTPGSTVKIISSSICTCVKVENNGTVNITTKSGCAVIPTPPSDGCLTWEN